MKIYALTLPKGVRSRVFNTLNNAGIETIEQLLATSYRELMRRPNFGRKSADALVLSMHHAGYEWPLLPALCPHCKRPMP